MKTLTSEELEILYLISASSALLSLLGNLFIIILFTCLTGLRLYALRLVFYISICDSVKSITLMIPGYFNIFQENICTYQGYFFAYSSLSGTIWVLAIAWSLNQALILNHHNIELYHKHWFISAMIVPAIISAFPFLTNSYGLSSAWCTLKENDVGRIWKFFMFYLPSWIIILITGAIYIKIAIKMKKCDKYATETEKVKKIINRVVAYPVIMIITFLPITIVRLFSLFSNNVNFFLMCFAYFSYGIYGFANSIAYGYNDTVLDSIKESVLKRKINTSEFFLTPELSHFK